MSASRAARRRFTTATVVSLFLGALFTVLLLSALPVAARESASLAGFVCGALGIISGGASAARQTRGGRRRAWLLLSSAAVVALAGNLWVVTQGIDTATEHSTVSDVSVAVAMLLSIVGLLNLHVQRRRGLELVLMTLDGLVMGSAALLVVTVTVYPHILDGEKTLGARAAALTFPVLDVALATLALLLVVRSRGNRVFFGLIGIGFLLYAASDLAFAVGTSDGDFAFGTWTDLGWIYGYLMLATATWHPHASRPATVRHDDSASDVQGTVLVLGVLVVAAVVQLTGPDGTSPTVTQVVLWIILILAASLRQVVLTMDNQNLRHGLEDRVRAQTADLRRLARQTEVLLRSVGDGIYGVDLDGRITFVNPPGAAALGLRVGDLIGRRAHDEFHAPDEEGNPFPLANCYVTEAIERGVVAAAEEDVYVRADGSAFPVEITASPLRDGEQVTGAVVVFRDMTQRREVDRMKDEFLSVVSHELRTPLTSIRGSLGLLSSGAMVELTPQAQRMVSIAVDSSDRLTRLINDILDIDRIRSGKLPMTIVPQEAAELLATTASQIAGLAASADVRVEVAAVSARVLADADRIVQTLTNLVGNAVKFSPAGSVVRLDARLEGEMVEFTVRDEGRGIPEELVERVFEPFEQVDSSDSRQMGGTGLGLSISRGIVNRHGGRIWAESSPGRGTTMHFTLPRASGVSPADAPSTEPTVLVVDDDPDVLDDLVGMLRAGGYRAVTATSGREAVAQAVRLRPVAVLLDLVMPQTTGEEVLAALRLDERTRPVPVVVVSVLRPDDEPEVAGQAQGWVVKPVTPDRLLSAVTAVASPADGDCVLLVEDDPDLAGVLVAQLGRHGLRVEHAGSIEAAVRAAREVRPRVIVLDLDLPDGEGSEVVAALREGGELAQTAVVVYSAADVESTDQAGVIRDANGENETVFLTKARTSPEELEIRVLRLMGAVTGHERS